MMKEDRHIHSNFSDGLNSPEEIVKTAISTEYEKICIVDHVREDTKWVPDFTHEILRLKKKYGSKIEIFSGIEAKVINLKGDLDLPKDIDKIDFIYSAFHRIPAEEREYLPSREISVNKSMALALWFTAMKAVLKNPIPNVIAHPGAILYDHGVYIPTKVIDTLIKEGKNKIFEINLRHRAPRGKLLSKLLDGKFKIFYGSDSHSVDELLFWESLRWRKF
ncbi:PHP domain-containing protein [candidate division WOR-3 bacterium]|nr:PHP domain-containing protein [candidate division WOR-3 bacterium]